jgi:acetoin:2,6-dichlorophenolindophenol oxidoreductase subunit alpha
VCENNQYATSVNVRRSTAVVDIGVRGAGYGIPGLTIDGNKVDEVYATAAEAVRRARAGEGPTLIECKTYRIRGHFEGDDCHYRKPEEVEEHRKRDPIDYWKKILVDCGEMDEATFATMSARIDEEITAAAEFAKTSPWPEPEDALKVPA